MADLKHDTVIYVGLERCDPLENITKEEDNNLVIIQRFLNSYNITNFFQNDLKALNNIKYLVLDLKAFTNSSTDAEIVQALDRQRQLYKNVRFIIIAQGYKKGNVILSEIVNTGIYNLVTSPVDAGVYDQLKNCFEEDGMSYAQAAQYKVSNASLTGSRSAVVQTNYEKIKQDISIGIIGFTRHIGATTWAINLLNYLNTLPNVKSCLIEANKHNDFEKLSKKAMIGKLGVEHLPGMKEVKVNGLDFYYDFSKITEITAQKYDFYLYDYGSLPELSSDDLASFLNKDLKFIVVSNSIFEEEYLVNVFNQLNPETENSFIIFNFTDEKEQKKIRDDFSMIKNIYFNEYQPDPFTLKSKSYLSGIMEKYTTNSSFKEVKKENPFSKIFKKKGSKK